MIRKQFQYEFWIPILIFITIISFSLFFIIKPIKKKLTKTQKHENILFKNISLKYISQGKTKWTLTSQDLKLNKKTLIAKFQNSTVIVKNPTSKKIEDVEKNKMIHPTNTSLLLLSSMASSSCIMVPFFQLLREEILKSYTITTKSKNGAPTSKNKIFPQ